MRVADAAERFFLSDERMFCAWLSEKAATSTDGCDERVRLLEETFRKYICCSVTVMEGCGCQGCVGGWLSVLGGQRT